ncbi:uncharacterized protein PAC_17403 [Phialocephala subalpina]|uniref:Uncharacterized protein n=1 Tax=Phialocephala subalpina TaxID=576137 RepID=A0A1L7XR35_9HELO|nr:uncharacterized protein PAC_17403 [Phialocephala subalpina]
MDSNTYTPNESWPKAAVISLSMLVLTVVLTPIGWVIQKHWIAKANSTGSPQSDVSDDTEQDLEAAGTLEEAAISETNDLGAADALEETIPM